MKAVGYKGIVPGKAVVIVSGDHGGRVLLLQGMMTRYEGRAMRARHLPGPKLCCAVLRGSERLVAQQLSLIYGPWLRHKNSSADRTPRPVSRWVPIAGLLFLTATGRRGQERLGPNGRMWNEMKGEGRRGLPPSLFRA